MKIIFLSFVAASLISLSGLAQIPKETPTPKTPAKVDDDVVIVNTNLIQIDVTVTDKKGKIITDLKKEDFEIFENKDKQDISNFSFVQNTINPPISKSPEKNTPGGVGIPIPPVKVRPETVKRTIALIVDDLTLSFESVYYVRRALKKFLDEQMQDGDLVAIIRTGGGIGALQQFTYDKQQLYAAIEKVKWNPNGTGKIGAFAPIEPSAADFQKNANSNMSDEDYQAAKNREREFQQSRDNYFVAGTLGAVNFVIKGMKELPGRKSVMLLSDGFSLIQADSAGFKEFSIIKEALQNLIETANRSSVVIYSVDARGLQTLGISAADNTSGLTQEQVSQQLSDRRETLNETQDTLRYLANETGGLAVVNSNDIGKGIQTMLDDQTGYYLIGYQPDDSTFDPLKRRFNKLTVRVNRPGLLVRYRSGFFGVADEEAKAAPPAQSVSNQILSAIASPFQKNEIVLNLNAMFGNEQKRGSFVRSFLHINAKDLTFKESADGKQETTFDIVAITFGDNGVPIDQSGKTYTFSINKESFEGFRERGFVYNVISWIAKPGAYQMRVVLRDASSGKIGSASQFIEVPNLKKDRLTLSSLVLSNYTEEDWKKSQGATTASQSSGDPMTDTALKRFHQNTVLEYGFEVYNVKLGRESRSPDLQQQIRVFRDGKIILDGTPKKIDIDKLSGFSKATVGGAIAFGKTMEKGDYVLQVVVTDKLAKQKNQIASQWIAFEIY